MHDRDDRLREAVLRAPHHLDRERAGKGEQRFGGVGHGAPGSHGGARVDAIGRRGRSVRRPRIHVLARQRMRQAAVGRLAGEDLPQRQPAAVERVRGAGEVDAPDAVASPRRPRRAPRRRWPPAARSSATASSRSARAAPRRRSTSRPCRRTPSITRATCVELAAGKDVVLDEVADAAAEAVGPGALCVMPWLSTKPPGFSSAPDLAEVLRETRDADVLEHADAGDLVVLDVVGQVEVVAQTRP